jgi:hypothetical protein
VAKAEQALHRCHGMIDSVQCAAGGTDRTMQQTAFASVAWEKKGKVTRLDNHSTRRTVAGSKSGSRMLTGMTGSHFSRRSARSGPARNVCQ